MRSKTSRTAPHAVKQRKTIPFHRRALQHAAKVRRMTEAAKVSEGYNAFNDPERYRSAVIRSLNIVRGLVQSGNRHFTEADEVATLQILEDDATRAIEALAHVETILQAAKIGNCGGAR